MRDDVNSAVSAVLPRRARARVVVAAAAIVAALALAAALVSSGGSDDHRAGGDDLSVPDLSVDGRLVPRLPIGVVGVLEPSEASEMRGSATVVVRREDEAPIIVLVSRSSELPDDDPDEPFGFDACGRDIAAVDRGAWTVTAQGTAPRAELEAIAASTSVGGSGAVTVHPPDGYVEIGRLPAGWRNAPGGSRLRTTQSVVTALRLPPGGAGALAAFRCHNPAELESPGTAVSNATAVGELPEPRTRELDGGEVRLGYTAWNGAIAVLEDAVLLVNGTQPSYDDLTRMASGLRVLDEAAFTDEVARVDGRTEQHRNEVLDQTLAQVEAAEVARGQINGRLAWAMSEKDNSICISAISDTGGPPPLRPSTSGPSQACGTPPSLKNELALLVSEGDGTIVAGFTTTSATRLRVTLSDSSVVEVPVGDPAAGRTPRVGVALLQSRNGITFAGYSGGGGEPDLYYLGTGTARVVVQALADDGSVLATRTITDQGCPLPPGCPGP